VCFDQVILINYREIGVHVVTFLVLGGGCGISSMKKVGISPRTPFNC